MKKKKSNALIYKDNIINNLQSYGGIKYFWDSIYRNIDNFEINDLYPKSKALRYMPLFYREKSPHLFHSSYYRFSLNKHAQNITTVHDFIYERYSSGLRRLAHSSQKEIALRNSQKIVCVSRTTLDDANLINFELDHTKVEVIYNGFNKFCLCDPEPVEENCLFEYPFFIFVGGRTNYKNFPLAVELVRVNPEYFFVIVGGGDLKLDEKKMLKQHLGDRYLFLKDVKDAKLKWLYQNAECLLYPSEYEGFGMPPLEAMYQGCPAFCLDTKIAREIYGDFLPLFRGERLDMASDFLRAMLKTKIEFDKVEMERRFNWKKAGNLYQELFHSLIK